MSSQSDTKKIQDLFPNPSPQPKPEPTLEPGDIVMLFMATLHTNGMCKVDAQCSSTDIQIQVNLVGAILQGIFTELLKQFDVPSTSRIITLNLLKVLDTVNPDAAAAIRELRRDSLPDLGKQTPGGILIS